MSQAEPGEEAFEALFREHYQVVLAYALRRADPDTARDVAAETFVVAWRRFERAPASPRPWLFGIARKVLANARRGIRRKHALVERLSAQPAITGLEDEGQADRSAVLETLATLGANDREILQLVAWEGLSTEELAVALGSSATASRVRLYRARRRFAAALARKVDSDPLLLLRAVEEP